MVIDSFMEWAVIGAGVVLAIFILFPITTTWIWKRIQPPHPTKVNNWLRKIGL